MLILWIFDFGSRRARFNSFLALLCCHGFCFGFEVKACRLPDSPSFNLNINSSFFPETGKFFSFRRAFSCFTVNDGDGDTILILFPIAVR